jgi:hypothetical protein
VADTGSAVVTITKRCSGVHPNFPEIDVEVVSYAVVDGPNQAANASVTPASVRSPTQAT